MRGSDRYSSPWQLTLFLAGLGAGILLFADRSGLSPAVAAVCNPRPAITLVTSVIGDGVLQTTVSGGSGAFKAIHVLAEGNAMTGNALVNVDGSLRAAPFSVQLSGPASFSFTSQRQLVAPMTVHIDIEDDCGKWRTFVGAGNAAWQFGSGDITSVNTAAGSGLQGGATSGDVNLSLMNCPVGTPLLRSNGTTWACGADPTPQPTATPNPADITSVNTQAGSGLQGGGASGDVNLALQTCTVSQPVLRFNGTSWACGAESSSIIGGESGSGAASSGSYFSLFGSLGWGNEIEAQAAVPSSGTISDFRVRMAGVVTGACCPDDGKVIFTIRKNGSDTTITCFINVGASSCSDLLHSSTFGSGDLFALRVAHTPQNLGAPQMKWTARWTPS